MSPRRRLLLLPVATVVSALLWSTFGSFSSASGQTDEPTVTIDRTHDGDLRPSFDEPIFVLVVGGDDLRGNDAEGSVRSDSVHIVAIDPVSKKTSIVGLARDSFVNIPGRGNDKLAHALFFGGIEGVVTTVENVSGCRFDYHMLTSFEGFGGKNWNRNGTSGGGIINDIGGITMNVERALTDSFALKKVDPIQPGKQSFSGAQALAWARSRKDASRPGGDFDRSRAQGEIMVAVLRELRGDFAKDPGTALRALGAVRRNVRMNIGLTESIELGLLLLDIAPKNVTNIVVDGALDSDPRAGSIVRITQEGRNQLTDVCSDGVLDNP